MKHLLVSLVALLTGLAAAVPLRPQRASSFRRRQNSTSISNSTSSSASNSSSSDVIILQFALTLEHLENVFYKQALLQFGQSDFQNAGVGGNFFEELLFVAEDEQSHVELLTAAISATGTVPVAACTYNFPFTDVQSFLTLSSVLESVGTSAYLGAAALLQDKTILTTAASIMVDEAIHTSQQRTVIGLIPAANSLGTPLGANAVFTLAASFISSCPPSNPPLPFSAFPSLSIDTSSCSGHKKRGEKGRHDKGQGGSGGDNSGNSEGSSSESSSSSSSSNNCFSTSSTIIIIAPSAPPSNIFITFISGLTIISIQASSVTDVTITASIPTGLSGQTYIFITNNAVSGSISDSDILMGPAVVEIAPTPPLIDNSVVRRGGLGLGSVEKK